MRITSNPSPLRGSRGRLASSGPALLLGCIALAGSPRGLDAQAPPAPPFTEAQAEAGAEVYRAKCALCHGPELDGKIGPPLVGKDFRANWYVGARTLGDLFQHISENMPMTDPGSLSPEEYAAVTAYLLLRNAHRPTGVELTPDAQALAAYPLSPPEPDAGGGP